VVLRFIVLALPDFRPFPFDFLLLYALGFVIMYKLPRKHVPMIAGEKGSPVGHRDILGPLTDAVSFVGLVSDEAVISMEFDVNYYNLVEPPIDDVTSKELATKTWRQRQAKDCRRKSAGALRKLAEQERNWTRPPYGSTNVEKYSKQDEDFPKFKGTVATGWIFGCRCERCRPVTLRRNKPSVVLIVRLMRKCKSASARVAWLTAMVLE
jgi:hypothetical protein